MDPISIPAHFDGRQILLDEPCELELNAKLIVTILPIMAPNMSHGWVCPLIGCSTRMMITKKSTRLI